jgi:hypothetical protein
MYRVVTIAAKPLPKKQKRNDLLDAVIEPRYNEYFQNTHLGHLK